MKGGDLPPLRKILHPGGIYNSSDKMAQNLSQRWKIPHPSFYFLFIYIYFFFPVSSALYIDISIYTHISRPPLIRAIPDGCARKEEQILRIWRGCRGSWFLLSTAHQTPRLSRGFPPSFYARMDCSRVFFLSNNGSLEIWVPPPPTTNLYSFINEFFFFKNVTGGCLFFLHFRQMRKWPHTFVIACTPPPFYIATT